MAVPPKHAVPLLPILAVLAACHSSPARQASVPTTTSAPPPVVTGALGAPIAPAPAGTAALSGGSTAPAPVAMPGAPTRMSADDILAAFSNHTAQGATTTGAPYDVYFSADGQERFRQGGFQDVGTWRVLPDGRFCSSLVRISSGNQECYIMHRSGRNITFQRPDGVIVGSVTLQPGNPDNL